jgi:hypothetical protein
MGSKLPSKIVGIVTMTLSGSFKTAQQLTGLGGT